MTHRPSPLTVGGGQDPGWLPFFRVAFAGAACWHLLGNAGLADGLPALLVGAGAAAVALWPRSGWAFAGLTAAVWCSIWQEAPILGNHWLLAGLVGLATVAGGLRPARVVVLVFYGFAAFAKLNADFFDPDTSCATFYAAESVRSFGLDITQPGGAAGTALLVSVAAIELTIPALLLWRRARPAGVALAIVFHAVVALDHRHQFYDFTSLLSAAFITFLPATVAGEWIPAIGQRVRLRVLQLLAAVLAISSGALAATDGSLRVPFELGYASWQLVALVLVPAAVLSAWRSRTTADAGPRAVGVPARAFVVVLLAVANGAAPYLEVMTATAGNMYATLRTAHGDSNHFLIRATWPAGWQDELVEVESADGPLRAYAAGGQRVGRRQLRWFLQQHPDATGVLRVGGERVVLEEGRVPTELGPPVPDVVGRLLALRAVPPADREIGCQDAFLPAT